MIQPTRAVRSTDAAGPQPRASGTVPRTQSNAYVRFSGCRRLSTSPLGLQGGHVSDGIGLGINLWSQASDWPAFLRAAQRAEELGYDHLWTWDHLLAIFGDPDQPIFEGYAALAAVAATTSRIRVGLFVGANTFRNPGLAVKAITTIDHISGGRAVMGIGGAWFEGEHQPSASTSDRDTASAWTGWQRPCRRCARSSTARRSPARPVGTTRSTACGSTRRRSSHACRS